MYSTQVSIYQQIARAIVMDSSGQFFTMRYEPVYAKKLTINKGVDNVLLFEFVNQDQKPVNVTGSNFLFRVVGQQGTAVLIEEPMVILNGPLGRVKVTIPQESTLEILAQPANYSIQRNSGTLNEAVFTGADAGARAPIDIVDAVLPQFLPSSPLTIPTTKLVSQESYDGSTYQNYPDWASQYGTDPGWINYTFVNTEFYSSFIYPRSALTTIQFDLVGYTGTIKAQWAEDYQSIWRNITESTTYFNETKTVHMNIVGWYPLLRLSFNNSVYATPIPPGVAASAYAICVDGELTSVEVQNGGSGYLAPPKIDIVGNGSEARAVAVMSDTWGPNEFGPEGVGYGSVVAINVTNGGSGYWPMPAGGVNPNQYPVPPANQGAAPIISTGFVQNLFYR